MNMMRATQFTGSLAIQERSLGTSGTAGLLQSATSHMATVLATHKLCIRVTLGANTIAIGDREYLDRDSVEFLFVSNDVFKRVFQSMRLLDFATAYVDGDMKINGPISQAIDALDAVNAVADKRQTISEISKAFIFRFLKALIPHIGRNFESLNHYAQSADAYELFLDRHMQYTCGRFETGDEDLDEAQLAKFDMIEKLARSRLGSLAGKDHLDIGCGWGGMLSYFEKQFGTRSVGNTNCRQQMTYAEQRFGSKIIYGDFSDLEDYNRRFDLITVVGMIKHLTPYRRSRLLETVNRLLNPNGIVYLQCITKPSNWVGGDAYRFVEREIFPGHYLESREMTENRLRRHQFRILSQFEQGFDYGLTTAHWARRIQENEAKLSEILGARRYRAYLGYLAFASKLFSTGRGSLMRYTLVRT